MGQSTGRELHVDQPLTQLAINYRPQILIADSIAPVVPVEKQSDFYTVFSRQEFFQLEDTERAPGTEARKVTRSVSSGQYFARNHALGRDVPIEDIANMDAALRFEFDSGAAKYILAKLGLGWEKRITTLAVASTSVGSVFVTNSSWAVTGANAGDPIAAIEAMREYVKGATGQNPNSLWFGWKAWSRMRRNVNARNLLNGTNNGKGFVTRQQIKDLFEMDRLIVSDSMWQTANEAQAQGTLTNAAEDRVFLYYAPLAASREDPSWLYTFRWSNPALPAPLVVERHPYDSRKKMETIEAGYYQDEKVVAPEYCASLITNVASGALGAGG